VTDYAEIERFIITRKQQVMMPPFVCVCCDRTIQDDEWGARSGFNKPPVCGMCAAHWGNQMRPSKVTRGDYRALQRLKAVVARLNWEIHNGQYANRRLTSW
jgi:hypothetical protein